MQDDTKGLRALIEGTEPVFAPLVLDPMMAKLAEKAGFPALYLGGGSTGYLKTVTEANLSLTEMCHAGLDIRTACTLPLILDGACGWGDPMHIHRTINMSEAAGFSAIEIEDQILPKRAHHHVGIEHIIPMELMVDKVREAVRARRSREFMIIARTNAVKNASLDEALRRGEAMHKAGADILFVLSRKPEELRIIAERMPAPLMYMISSAGLAASGMTVAELYGMGFRLFVDPVMPLLAMHRALRQSYAALKEGRPDPTIGAEGHAEQQLMHETIGLEKLLDIERRTVEK